MNDLKTIILFGMSGAGKGTQAKLLIDYFERQDAKKRVLYIETGQRFREFMMENGPTSALTKKVVENGGLLPAFLPIWIWSEYLIKHYVGNEHMILDGLSRRASEAPILDSALKFYDRREPLVISIKASREWCRERLLARGRKDDNEEHIKSRLDWYEESVVPTVDFFKNNPYYRLVEINGEQSKEKVHEDILHAVFQETKT